MAIEIKDGNEKGLNKFKPFESIYLLICSDNGLCGILQHIQGLTQ